jgi:nitroreductase
MDTFKAISTRRSIRKYTNKQIPQELINKLLKAAMYAPSAMNYQPWHFIVFDTNESLTTIHELLSHADMLAEAACGILVCGDLELERNIDFIVQNCSAATQNILLEAHELGLGAVWVGVFPEKQTMQNIKRSFGLPESIVPISLVPIGYPNENPGTDERFKPDKVHYNSW